MLAQLKETYRSFEELMSPLEEMDRQVWERHSRVLEDVTHVLGGVGLGLLAYSAIARWARPIGAVFVGLSFLLHLYAFVTSRPAVGARARIGPLVS